jgi:hypothetical protein
VARQKGSQFSGVPAPPPAAAIPVDFRPDPPETTAEVKKCLVLLLVLFLGCAVHAAEKKRFILYATMITDTGVQLEDGTQWIMDKGDTFPVVMFKEQQTKIVLQLAGASFITSAANVRVVEEKDVTPEQLATYRTNVQHYLDGQAEKWKTEHSTVGRLGQPGKGDQARAAPAKTAESK